MKHFLIYLLFVLQVIQPAYAGSGFIGPALYEGQTSTVTAAGTTTLTVASETVQVFTGSTTQTLVLPDATTFPKAGRYFYIWNESSGAITVNKNGGALLTTVAAGSYTKVYNSDISTAAGTWDVTLSSVDLSGSLVTGILPLSKGGSNKNMTAVAGGLVWTDSDSMEVSAAGTTGYFAKSNGTSAPSWLAPDLAVISGLPALSTGKFLTNNGTTLSWGDAGLATQGFSEASSVTTTTLKAPFNQFTTIATNTRRLETGNLNVLADPDCEASTGACGVSALTGTTFTDETGSFVSGLHSKKVTLTNVDGTAFWQDWTPASGQKTVGTWEHGLYIANPNSLTTLQVCPRQGGSFLTSFCQNVPSTASLFSPYFPTYPAPLSGSIGYGVRTTANTNGDFYIDNSFVGPVRNSNGTAPVPYNYGVMRQAGATSCSQLVATTNETTYNALGNGSGCNTPTFTGSGSNSSPNTLQYVMGPHPAGSYTFRLSAPFYNSVAAKLCNFRFSDGTNTFGALTTSDSVNSNTGGPLIGTVTLPAASSRTVFVQASGTASGSCGVVADQAGRAIEWSIDYTPTSSQAPTSIAQGADLLGTVFYTGASICPVNSLAADGTAVSRTTYSTLFNKISTTFGTGDGSTTFNVPDMRGIFIRGAGTQSVSGTSYSGTLGTKTAENMKNHIHQWLKYNGTATSNQTWNSSASATNLTTSTSTNGTHIQGVGSGTVIDNDGYTNTQGSVAGGETAPANIGMTPCIWVVSQPYLTQTQSVVSQDNSTGVTTINTVVSKSADYTATVNEDKIIMDSSGAARTLSLPAAASVKGKEYLVINSSSSNSTTIDPNASETICGQTTVKLIGIRDKMRIFSDGTNWQSDDCIRVLSTEIQTTTAPACIVHFQNGGTLTCTRNATGNATLSFTSGSFSGDVQCSALARTTDATMYGVIRDSNSSHRFQIRRTTDSTAFDGNMEIICRGPR